MDLSWIISALSPGGALAENLASFEYRKQQQQMTEAVLDALVNERVLMVEAGTGTGKSLAYGLPMAAWALKSGERVVLSTGTINLQQQLVAKDLPLVSRVLGEDLEVVLLKGRANYLCRRRLDDLVKQMSLFEPGPQLAMLPMMMRWADNSTDGSRSDLDEPVPDSLWSLVCADSDACLGRKCPMINDCFVQRARDAAGRADVLVVNHHLLFADLALRMELDDWTRTAVLPPFERLVLDEAHGLEDAASAFFGSKVSRKAALGLLGSLFKSVKDQKTKPGILNNLALEYERLGGQLSYRSLAELAKYTRAAVDGAFDMLVQFSEPFLGDSPYGKLRLNRDLMIQGGWVAVGEAFRTAANQLDKLSRFMEEMLGRLESQSDDTSAAVEGRLGVKRLGKLAESFRRLTEYQEEEKGQKVQWVELGSNPSGRFVSIASAPLDLADKFKKILFNNMRTVVLTSATLTVKGSFEYQASRLGLDLLDGHSTRTLRLESPFDFSSSAVLAIPFDSPEPRDARFEQWLPNAIVRLVGASSGGALVLFTSWKLMMSSFDRSSSQLQSMGMEALCQGLAPRHKLLSRFRHNSSSVLLGPIPFGRA